jgi:hypothetical protein
MATRPKKISVSVTPGSNAPVEHVVRLEDLLKKMQATKPAGRRAAAADPARRLAAELEARLRELRQKGKPT